MHLLLDYHLLVWTTLTIYLTECKKLKMMPLYAHCHIYRLTLEWLSIHDSCVCVCVCVCVLCVCVCVCVHVCVKGKCVHLNWCDV